MGHRPAVVLSLILLVVAGTARAGEGAPVNTWTGAAPSGACKGSRVATVATTGQSYCCVSSTWRPCSFSRSLADLNVPPTGFAYWVPTTLNRPSTYGSVLSWEYAGRDPDVGGSGLWRFQLGFDTVDQIWARSSINVAGWSTWRRLWHSGNVGAGSGLDADLLDGQHGSYYAPVTSPVFYGDTVVGGAITSRSSTLPQLVLTATSLVGEQRALTLQGDYANTEVAYWSPVGWKHKFYYDVNVAGKLTVAGESTFNGPVLFTNNSWLYGAGVQRIYFASAGASYFASPTQEFYFGTAGSPYHTLLAPGGITTTGNITAYGSVSDARLKRDVEPISGALAKALSLRGVEYDWREELLSGAGFNPTRGRVTGLIAQDVQRVLPDAVYEARGQDGETYLGVRYERVVPLLLEAIRELNAKVERLEARQ